MSGVCGANEEQGEVEGRQSRDLGLVRGMMNQYFFYTRFLENQLGFA